ncbi:MAG: malto-oligosyltrehalose trehalohydrolase, partial [Candidatus Elarobacter sp.]
MLTAAVRSRLDTMPFGADLREGGTTFRLWAPSQPASSVDLSGALHAMERRDDGWFETTVAGAVAGTRYAFRFPGIDLAVPDPASRRQPDGAHAPSEVVDPRAYAWRENAWHGRPWHEMVFYELHVGTFTEGGTYASALERLDALVSLGVTAIELMPLAQPAGARNWG